MELDATQKWIRDNKKVCICNSITRKTISEAVIKGARTLDEVAQKTRASTGSCNGSRCDDKILEIIQETIEENSLV